SAGLPDESAHSVFIGTSHSGADVVGDITPIDISYGSTPSQYALGIPLVPNTDGTATITIEVYRDNPWDDGTGNVAVVTFQLTVLHANQPPALDPTPDLTIAAPQTLPGSIELSGLAPGPLQGDQERNQSLTVTAVSSNPGLIPDPVVDYTNPNAFGMLRLSQV